MLLDDCEVVFDAIHAVADGWICAEPGVTIDGPGDEARQSSFLVLDGSEFVPPETSW